eukprot:3137572-Pyramimonas_sp.AAC.1
MFLTGGASSTLTIVIAVAAAAAIVVSLLLGLHLWKRRQPSKRILVRQESTCSGTLTNSTEDSQRTTTEMVLLSTGHFKQRVSQAESEPRDPFAVRLTMLRGIMPQVRQTFCSETLTKRTCGSYE